MQLTEECIKRIEALGFKREKFVKYDADGFARLKNKRGYCVFYNRRENKCIIYENRPIGCKLYPIVYDPQKNTVTVDKFCPAANTITEKELENSKKILMNVIHKLYREAEERKSRKQKN